MAIQIQQNTLRSVLVNETTNPDFFHGDDDHGMTLEAMQKLVGGDIEVKQMKHVLMVDGRYYSHIGFNEEGKRLQLPPNAVATEIAHKYAGIAKDDFVVGDAVLFEQFEVA